MAIGVIFLSLTPGTNVDLLNFLFGNILWIEPRDLWLLFGLNTVVLSIVFIYYRPFLALCFDEEQALLQGVSVRRLYLLLLTLVAISVVLLIQIIGTILVLALLTIPATLAALFTKRIYTLMIAATLLSAFCNWSGLEASYYLNWPPGATIALIAASLYLIALPIRKNLRSPA
jgi:zinc transport system permease protein